MSAFADILDIASVSWPILAGLFTTGMVGGLGHCVPMCGPFVLAQGASRQPQLARPGGMLLLPYHLGRLTTYVALGAAAGGLSGMVAATGPFRWAMVAFLGLAALLFLSHGAAGLARWMPALRAREGRPRFGVGLAGRAGLALARLVRPLLYEPSGWNGYVLGVALGFLPCGLLYAALAAAAGVGGAAGGGLAMLAFALGTMPALLAVGLMGALAGRRWAGFARLAAPPLMLGNAVLLAGMAWHAAG